MRPPRAMGWRDFTALARYEPQASAVERFAQRRRHLAASVPAQLRDDRLLAREPKRGGETRPAAACMKHEIAIARRGIRLGKASAERVRELRARRSDIDHRDLGAR